MFSRAGKKVLLENRIQRKDRGKEILIKNEDMKKKVFNFI
jgi:hypothetical protein